MGQLRSPEGEIVEVPDDQVAGALAVGFKLVSNEQVIADDKQRGIDDRANARGILGTANAALSSAASGATLGVSDMLLGTLLSDGERARLNAEREANPIASGVGQAAGMILPSLVNPGSLLAKTPAGLLAQASNKGTTIARGLGGAKGLATAAAITGAEGGLQNAGIYLGETALGDRELTAEGMAGALGMGFGFGAVAGGAVFGLERGTMAARRMFARSAEGGTKAVGDATAAFSRASDTAVTANDDVAAAARKRLDEIRAQQAELAQTRVQADAEMARSKLDAFAEQRAAAGRGATEEALPPVDAPSPTAAGGVRTAADPPAATPTAASADAPTKIPTAKAVVEEAAEEGVEEVGEEVATAASGRPDRVEVFASGRPSKPVYEVRVWRNGAPEPEIRPIKIGDNGRSDPSDLAAAFDESLPDGFNRGPNVTLTNAFGGASIETGIPVREAIKDNSVYIIRPSEFAEHVVYGDELRPGAVDSIKQAWSEGKRLAPLDIEVAPSGRMYISDGNHRMVAAAADNRPLVVRFRKEAEENGLGTAFDVGDRVRAELPTPSPTRALPAATAGDVASGLTKVASSPLSLEELLGQTVSRLQGGESFARLNTQGQIAANIAEEEAKLAAILGRYDDARERMQTAIGSKAADMGAAADDLEGEIARIAAQGEVADAAVPIAPGATAEDLTDAAVEASRAKAGVASHVDDVTAGAKAIDDYERASAELTEAMGDAATPEAQAAAKAYRDAEAAADAAALDRTTRAIDDSADEVYGPTGPQQGPTRRTPDERYADAKQAKLDAKAQGAALKAEEIGVRRTIKDAKATAKQAKLVAKNAGQAAETIGLPGAPTAAASGKQGEALDLAAVLEAAGTVGVPGLPKPSDIPVIGPLLGVYLKFRALKALAGRMTGRVEATGNARAAALAAKTKEKIAAGVDRSLGLVAKAAPKTRVPVLAAGSTAVQALHKKIFDDGEETPKDATPQQLAAARIRELGVAAASPRAVITAVRKEMRDVADPALIAAAEQTQLRRVQYLNDIAPKAPEASLFSKREWTPSPAATMSFARSWEVAHDPHAAFEQLEQKCISPEAAKTLRNVYPKLFQLAQMRLLERAPEIQTSVPYQDQIRMSLLFDVPLDRSLEPATIASLQTAFADSTSPADPTQQQGAPQPMAPVPSIAAPTQLSSLFETAGDRRAARR